MVNAGYYGRHLRGETLLTSYKAPTYLLICKDSAKRAQRKIKELPFAAKVNRTVNRGQVSFTLYQSFESERYLSPVHNCAVCTTGLILLMSP